MNHEKTIGKRRLRRRRSTRNRVRGTSDRPRLSVFRSHGHVYCQVIDDSIGRTLAAASTRDKDVREQLSYGGNKGSAEVVGKALAERALSAGVTQVCFDRGHYQYHGRVAALADAAREAGLKL